MSERVQLDAWKGDWGLPSVDIECLQVMAYARFSGIPLQIQATNNPFKTSNGRLPVLKTKHSSLDKINEIMLYLKKINVNLVTENGSKEYAEFIAYDTMLKDKLYPAMQFIWWLDQANLNELIRPWYCDAVYSEAQKCLTSLSTRLGDSKYFLGQSHTMLDAVIYSYLAPLLKAPLVNPPLQNHLKACTNLVNFVTHISQKYFREDYNHYEKIKNEDNIRKMRKDSFSEFPNKRRDQVLAGLFAVVAMVGYALLTGKLEMPIKDKKMINEDEGFILNEDEDE
ncbi:hypothetical protein M0802_007631 [Mischocyttarus mexicanus]|nr:hypothetical protein M0802_007631 [Mischocyttarus mexicanus]